MSRHLKSVRKHYRPRIVVDARRSRNMRSVRAKNTGPELIVRSALHALGLRFRLHRSDLPGRPDLVMPKWRTVIFVNGCFWHRHSGCNKAKLPKTNAAFWKSKLARNVERDRNAIAQLRQAGWRVIVIWECNLRDQGVILALAGREFGIPTLV